jgi:hypothetical protein
MKVLDRLPIAKEHFRLNVHGEPLKLRPYQIIIQFGISPYRPWDPQSPVIPALFDSGNNHITPARKKIKNTNPTRQRGFPSIPLAGASG